MGLLASHTAHLHVSGGGFLVILLVVIVVVGRKLGG